MLVLFIVLVSLSFLGGLMYPKSKQVVSNIIYVLVLPLQAANRIGAFIRNSTSTVRKSRTV